MIEEFDNLQTYCRKLGHTLHFSYCRIENNRIPCSKITDCWFQRIPIQDFLQKNYTQSQIERMQEHTRSRLEIILDMAEQLKNRAP